MAGDGTGLQLVIIITASLHCKREVLLVVGFLLLESLMSFLQRLEILWLKMVRNNGRDDGVLMELLFLLACGFV